MNIIFFTILFLAFCEHHKNEGDEYGDDYEDEDDDYEYVDTDEIYGDLKAGYGKYFYEREGCYFGETWYEVECSEGCTAYIMDDDNIDEFIQNPNELPTDYITKVEVEPDVYYEESDLKRRSEGWDDDDDKGNKHEHGDWDDDDEDDDEGRGKLITDEEYGYYILIFNNYDVVTKYEIHKNCPDYPLTSGGLFLAGFIVLVIFCCFCFVLGCVPLMIIMLLVFGFVFLIAFFIKKVTDPVHTTPRTPVTNLNGDQNMVVPVHIPERISEIRLENQPSGMMQETTNPDTQPMMYADTDDMKDV